MGNIPVVAEVTTACQSLGDAVTGNPEAALQRWQDYSEASVIGSGVRAAIAASQNDMAEAERLGKAMGRATGSALAGGGFLKTIPVFHEIATAGDCLGDMIAGGDVDAANKRWGDYSENSVVDSGVRAAIAASQGDMEEATRLGVNMGKAIQTRGKLVGVVSGAVVAAAGTAAEKAIQELDAADIVAIVAMELITGTKV